MFNQVHRDPIPPKSKWRPKLKYPSRPLVPSTPLERIHADHNKEAESNISRAQTKEDALNNAILAIELYMKATRLASSELEKARLRVKCKQLLSRAEEIKQAQWPPKENHKIPLKAPISTRAITRQEEIILLEGSKLHGFIFPRWTSDPDDSIFEEVVNGSDLYM